MELQPGSKQKAVGELLTKLLSRDPVIFNSAINSNFASNVTYSGHGLKFRGASNLKHAAWLFNEIFNEAPATFDIKDIEWNEETSSATIHTIRYLRPRLFPLYGLAIPVETHLRFNVDEGDAGKNASQTEMYVTKVEDLWLLERILEPFPLVAWLYTALVTPIATLLVLALSNVLFAGNARIASGKRQYIDTSVDVLSDRARKALPAEVASNVGYGYQMGEKLAQGWGTSLVHVVSKTSYPLLSTLEVISQKGASIIPLPIPYPFIYDAHSHPPKSGKKDDGKKITSKSTTSTNSNSNSSAPSQDQKTDGKLATVEVAPSLDGGDQGKSVEIASRINNESKDEPAPIKKPETDSSLYSQLKKDGQLPKVTETKTLSLPVNTAHAGASSEEEEHPSSHGATNGAHKKKKSGSKKKKGGASHVHPPSFKEGLHQAVEQEHNQ